MNAGASLRIALRADGGLDIGRGHVTRCAALLRALAVSPTTRLHWLTRTPDAITPLCPPSVSLHSIGNDEAGDMLSFCREKTIGAVIGDWPSSAPTCAASLRHAGLFYAQIGNQADPGDADLTIRQSLAATGPARPDTLDGPDYLLLPDHLAFMDAERESRPAACLLLSLGAGRTGHLKTVLDALASWPGRTGLDLIITGSGADALSAPGWRSVEHLPPGSDLLTAMRRADLAVLAGGTTLSEAAACGLPTICIPVADNQQSRARDWHRLDLGISLDVHAPEFAARLTASLDRLIASPELRNKWARACRDRVDGHGAQRCARQIGRRLQAIMQPPVESH